jgi:hypothetical protein
MTYQQPTDTAYFKEDSGLQERTGSGTPPAGRRERGDSFLIVQDEEEDVVNEGEAADAAQSKDVHLGAGGFLWGTSKKR